MLGLRPIGFVAGAYVGYQHGKKAFPEERKEIARAVKNLIERTNKLTSDSEKVRKEVVQWHREVSSAKENYPFDLF